MDNSENKNDVYFMRLAMEEAKKAAEIGEVPVGALVVCDGEIVSTAFNTRETGKNALHHAEIKAIDGACARLKGWRLHKCDLYVTLEPCPMCAGAIVNARIKRVIFGAHDMKAGAFGSVFNMNDLPLNHKPEIVSDVCKDECAALLSEFFAKLRQTK
ncbi:MAG: tRNA adenosine(34) deaminase TadA [Clostridia bacterium]|nr:tRNA adenosine(34) deaminase TadA [Clostridia bacterium]